MTGKELDASLRRGAARGQSSLAHFGRLLAATQNGGPRSLTIDTRAVKGRIVGVFVCRSDRGGTRVSVTSANRSLLWFASDGCDASNIYSGESRPLGSASGGSATLQVGAPAGGTYAVVIEEADR